MSQSLPPLIETLLDPRCYPHRADPVERIETHTSWLLLAGDFVYKIKKAITLPFLDYGTLAQREAFCRAELALNRRFAPDMYLDVVPIGGTPVRPRLGVEPAIEWAVRMRRFDELGRLDRVAARGELQPAHLSQLAASLWAFQQSAAVATPDTRFGAAQQILATALENFGELRQLLPQSDQPQIEQLALWTGQESARRAAAFAARKAGGSVREGHGDLHLANLVLIDGRVTPFDCIEFNEDLRWIDTANELAFTWIDLLDHRQPGLAAWLLNAWLEVGGDFAALAVLRFYAVYRAVVRAKVAALRARQEDARGDRAEIDSARDYLRLAWRIAVTCPGLACTEFHGADRPSESADTPTPNLLITCGLSGSGKTTLTSARLLDAAAPAAGRVIRLRSDVERKRLFGLAPLEKSGSAVDRGIYTAEATKRTYARLHALAGDLLADGWPVIVDAAFLRREERAAFRALAATLGVDFRILCPVAPAAELRRRLSARRGDASEATVAVLEQQQAWFEPLDEDEQRYAVSA